jgi:NADH:ubiquinone oxidoreductase subunit F (NADH-binding)
VAVAGLVERVLDRQPCERLQDHVAHGGGQALDAARAAGPEALIATLEAAGLRGRGGAGFPTGTKWRTVAAAGAAGIPTPVVVNGAEGEPGTFKDRELLRMNPYKIVEGALIAAAAVGAVEVVFALKASFRRELARLRAALAEVEEAGWAKGLVLRVVEGPSEYLYGEETGLLEVIDGRQPFPRVTPPYRRGLDEGEAHPGHGSAGIALATPGGGDDAPALVDNVETLANVPAIVLRGPDWFRELGTPRSPGTVVVTVTGATRRHAVGEVALGTTLRDAIQLVGDGPRYGHHVVGVLPGVSSGVITAEHLDTPLTYEDLAAIGSGLGSAGFIVLDEETDVLAVAHAAARFLAVESCGQCEPCKDDGLAIAAHLEGLASVRPTQEDLDALPQRLSTVARGARCSLATQQERVIGSLLAAFPGHFRRRLEGVPAEALPPEGVLPLVDISAGEAVLDTEHLTKQPDWTHEAIWDGRWPAQEWEDTPVHVRPTRVQEVDEPATEALSDEEPDGR